ncbi:MAG: shikimate dehydrogenase [Verrucomicrobia bacterium]|nr:MAG: shikimate dehydrogenase [Verrucomicrobiota bacterium]
MKIGSQTKVYAVLGHPIGHTFSPAMHNAAFAALGLDALYCAFDVAPQTLLGVLTAMREMGLGGLNLTVPLKEVAFRGLARLDASAKRLGAVNTIEFAHEGLVGHNTDGYGFLRAHEEAFGCTPKDSKVFVLGAGGAGRAVALMCAEAGAREITLGDLDVIRCHRVAGEIRDHFSACAVHVSLNTDHWPEAVQAAELIVQATPVGMKADEKPLLGAAAFHQGQRFFDLIYWFPETIHMQMARAAGATAANGLGMLLHQGARAFEIWTGQTAPLDAMRTALENELAARKSAQQG